MPKDILHGQPPVSWQSVGCLLFQRGVAAKTKEATVKARTKRTINADVKLTQWTRQLR